MSLGMEVGLGPGDFVLDRYPGHLPKRGLRPLPIFGPCQLWPNGWMDHDGTWHGGGRRPRQHCYMGTQAPSEKGHSPQFSAHVYCGQMAGWIKMPLGLKVGLGPCHIVLDGDPTPSKGAQQPPPSFWPMSIKNLYFTINGSTTNSTIME